MKVLFIINDAPYGTEKAYNALRVAIQAQKDHNDDVRIFLLADAVACAIPGQSTADGYYNIERMLKSVLSKGGEVKACSTCLQARGLHSAQLIEGVERSSMAELANWLHDADKTVTF